MGTDERHMAEWAPAVNTAAMCPSLHAPPLVADGFVCTATPSVDSLSSCDNSLAESTCTADSRPITADGNTIEEAVDETVSALREYAGDWPTRFRTTPNHHQNWPLIQLICLSTDAQLRNWLTESKANVRQGNP
ncbi:hypothetical protein AB0M22_13105 [Nocardia sp. NPDC051756]|uniref:hypothetical protein n=1 Tax=Nocardia sp. NPDC051756 TaxID=3154751 RepID=UPI00342A51F4